MPRSGGPIQAEIDPAEWARLLRDLRRLAPEVRKQLTRELKSLLGPMSDTAKRQASWSSRIPSAITKTVAARKVGLRVNSGKVPHARPYEGISAGGDSSGFRHPVFGNRGNWVQQRTRPFLKPAVEEHRDDFMESAGDAVDKAAREAGWK